jgi:hypothetical protein
MFGYVVGYIGAHLLEKVWIILVARSSGKSLGIGTRWLDRTCTGRAGVPWTLWNGNEEGKVRDLLWHGWGCLGVLL